MFLNVHRNHFWRCSKITAKLGKKDKAERCMNLVDGCG
jgi:hypothetical protein